MLAHTCTCTVATFAAVIGALMPCSYGLHDSYDCRANRATRSMCVLPWTTGGTPPNSSDVGTLSGLSSMHGAKPWRLLTGHDSGNILMFDPALPHFKPLLTIKFPPFSGVAPVSISVLSTLHLLVITRSDGMVQLMSMITPENRIMASAIDPMQPVRLPHTYPPGISQQRSRITSLALPPVLFHPCPRP